MAQAQAEWVWSTLWSAATAADAPDELVRLAAMVGIVRVSRARRAEVLALTTGSYRPRARRLTVARTKWGRIHTVPVDDDLHAVLRKWMRVRGRLVEAHVEGGAVDALFVTVHHTMWRGARGAVTKQVGLPLDEQGLLLSWKRWAARTNAEQAGRYGWVPLPTRFEQVRRAWG
ncbi:tyrosine-type recombinase/integrase [Streptomyces monticola]|uniref:Tyrosine-type recombinase/integrase n=1 Tax=Streptomyces monticola TaxID=2666263 RepID=A0ABW2JGM1_9ACTN